MSTTQPIIEALRLEIQRSRKWGRKNVSIARLESLIRTYTIDTVGDISDQPGKWSMRGGNVEAVQHSGGVSGARFIREWVKEHGGETQWMGTYDQEVDYTRVRLDSPRQPNIVGPGWWVVKTADGIFFTVTNTDFHILYVPRKQRDGED
jgi:hypothetical protein